MINHRTYGTNKSESLTILRNAGFKPIAVTHMMCEETFVFNTEEEATRAHDEFEHHPKHKHIIQGWWYGREYFNETIVEYRTKFCDDKIENSPDIYWLEENIITKDSFELYFESIIERLKFKNEEGGMDIEFTYSEEEVNNNKEYFKDCWICRMSPYKALTFLCEHINP